MGASGSKVEEIDASSSHATLSSRGAKAQGADQVLKSGHDFDEDSAFTYEARSPSKSCLSPRKLGNTSRQSSLRRNSRHASQEGVDFTFADRER
jgi:hypothetical protein